MIREPAVPTMTPDERAIAYLRLIRDYANAVIADCGHHKQRRQLVQSARDYAAAALRTFPGAK